jgi:RHS repeat-associated protein
MRIHFVFIKTQIIVNTVNKILTVVVLFQETCNKGEIMIKYKNLFSLLFQIALTHKKTLKIFKFSKWVFAASLIFSSTAFAQIAFTDLLALQNIKPGLWRITQPVLTPAGLVSTVNNYCATKEDIQQALSGDDQYQSHCTVNNILNTAQEAKFSVYCPPLGPLPELSYSYQIRRLNASEIAISNTLSSSYNTEYKNIGTCRPEEENECKADSLGSDGLSTPNPIVPATGDKLKFETDFIDQGPHPLTWRRYYNSNEPALLQSELSQWQHNHAAQASAGDSTAYVRLPQGRARAFAREDASQPFAATNSADRLDVLADGTLKYQSNEDNSSWQFDAAGKVLSVTQRNGWVMNYSYNAAGQLSQITNKFGRSLLLAYNGSGLISQVTQPDGRLITYQYAVGLDNIARLSRVIYPDSRNKIYHYENPSFPNALTGVTDENNTRLATYTYDSQGRATSSELAGAVARYSVSYPTSEGAPTQVTDPLNTNRTYNYSTNFNRLSVTGGNKPSGQGLRDAANRIQNPLGLVDSETDYLGFITTTSWDTTRRLPTQVVRASGTPAEQTVQTQWHPTLRLPTLVTEAGRTIAMTYNALGNKLTETITDESLVPNTVRTTAWTYNAQGLVATERAPNNAVTAYTYDSAGNPLTMRNALGHITTMAYAGADGQAGRVTSMTAPTGLVTNYTYDLRGRLLTLTQTAGASALATLYTYTPSGQLASAALPSGHAISYSYDAAQRLTGWQDNRGATGVYTLDAMGNRTTEQIKNSAGQVVWQLARSINALNRVASETVGNAAGTVNSNQLMTYGYNANGSLTSEANGLQQATTYGLDGLRRVTQITNAANASAALAYNALDAVTSASDFKGVVTTTPRDALGNAVSTTSPDAGAQTAQYDALGLPKQIVDALGQATSITRDALGRPTSIVHADGRNTTLRYDLTGATYNAAGFANASKGYLSEIADTTDNTKYLRDGFGRVVRKTQQLAPFAAGTAKNIQYSYASGPTGNGNGQLNSITYPNGTKVSYLFSPAGQISQVNWGNNPLVANIQYTPLGQPASWVWQFADTNATTSLTATLAYDTAGRVVATELSTYTYDAAGRITSLSQQLYSPFNSVSTSTAVTATTYNFTIGYDNLGRIDYFRNNNRAYNAGFSYDANGNRTTSYGADSGGGASRTYTVDPNSNRLLGFNQTLIAAANRSAAINVSYTYDANGAMLSDGLRRYEYDAANRLANVTTGAGVDAPTTRYVHNALGQRLFKTEPQFAPVASGSDPANPGVMQTLLNFFGSLWGGSTTPLAPSVSDKLGFQYYYDEDGSLLYEAGTGGASSTGSAHYVYLPTPNGPMPIAFYNGSRHYAVHTDHLNTPRRLTQSDKKVAWQWAFSAFGDEQPTTGRNRFVDTTNSPSLGTTTIADVTFNLRYPGQYFDKESGLSYNWMRSYSPDTGRYTQSDPIDLQGGWNRFGYAAANPLTNIDPDGRIAFAIPPIVTWLVGGGTAATGWGTAAVGATAVVGISTISGSTNRVGPSWPSWPPVPPNDRSCPPSGGGGDPCYEQCKHLLPSPSGDLQASEYRACYRKCKGSLF